MYSLYVSMVSSPILRATFKQLSYTYNHSSDSCCKYLSLVIFKLMKITLAVIVTF